MAFTLQHRLDALALKETEQGLSVSEQLEQEDLLFFKNECGDTFHSTDDTQPVENSTFIYY